MSEELNVSEAGGAGPEAVASLPETSGSGAPEAGSTPTPQADPNRTTRQDIEAAFQEVEEKEAKRRGNPYKSADGKFAKKPLEAKEAPKTEAAPAETNPEAKPTETQEAPQALEMPKSWSKDKAELWTALPQAAKDLILSRENQVNEGFAKYQGIEPKYKALDAVLAPLDPMINGYGTTREAFVKQLADWHQALANNPQVAFPALMQAYGYQLPQSDGSPQPTDAQQIQYQIPPQLQQLPQQFGQLTQKLEATESQLQAIRQEQTNKEIAAFASKPEHKHFEKLRVPMGKYIQAVAQMEGRVPDLKEAYDFAFRGDAELWAAHQREEFEATIKKQKEEAEKSRLASQASLKGRSPAGANLNGAANSNGSVRGDIEAAMQEYAGRA